MSNDPKLVLLSQEIEARDHATSESKKHRFLCVAVISRGMARAHTNNTKFGAVVIKISIRILLQDLSVVGKSSTVSLGSCEQQASVLIDGIPFLHGHHKVSQTTKACAHSGIVHATIIATIKRLTHCPAGCSTWLELFRAVTDFVSTSTKQLPNVDVLPSEALLDLAKDDQMRSHLAHREEQEQLPRAVTVREPGAQTSSSVQHVRACDWTSTSSRPTSHMCFQCECLHGFEQGPVTRYVSTDDTKAALESWTTHFGVPHTIQSEDGPEFCGPCSEAGST
eukprot:6323381-Amphidinium_carterae.4